jgi:DNA repair exonuclease SbcCD ATPase subunit
MSDDAKDDKAPAASGDGFTAAPPPPAVSPEEAAAAEAAEAAAGNQQAGDEDVNFAGQMPDGSIAVPHDTAKRALEAVQVLVENNRAASQQLESLMTIVLDAAEVANRSASAVATTGGHVNKAAEKLIDGAQRTALQAKVILALAGAVLVGCAGVFSFMSVQLQNKVTQLDEMMLAVGKRAVDLKRRMESMDDIHQALEELKLSQENTQSVQEAIESKIAKLSEAPRAPARPEPKPAPAAPAAAPAAAAGAATAPAKEVASAEAAAKKAEAAAKADAAKAAERARADAARAEAARIEAQNKALLQQLTALDGMLKDQSRAVKDLSGQFNKLEGSVANVQSVKKDVEALAAQQKQREKEMAQELAAANARRDKDLKEKERELARERERAREIKETKERELVREREQAAKDRQAAEASAREKKEATIAYARDQARQKTADAASGTNGSTGAPSYRQPKAEQ